MGLHSPQARGAGLYHSRDVPDTSFPVGVPAADREQRSDMAAHWRRFLCDVGVHFDDNTVQKRCRPDDRTADGTDGRRNLGAGLYRLLGYNICGRPFRILDKVHSERDALGLSAVGRFRDICPDEGKSPGAPGWPSSMRPRLGRPHGVAPTSRVKSSHHQLPSSGKFLYTHCALGRYY